MPHVMVDRDRPPSDSELDTLQRLGVEVVAGYVGGPNRNPNYWTVADFDRCQQRGLKVLPIWVGQNVCPGCWAATLTYAQGHIDGLASIPDAQRFGFRDGLYILDVEYDTYWSGGADACNSYASGWAQAVSDAGYRPVIYGPTGMWQTFSPGVPVGYWVADWDGIGNLARFPDPGRYYCVGWQYGDQWYGFDVSNVDDMWTRGPGVPKDVVDGFGTGFRIQGGIAQAWQHDGGLIAHGQPISNEYDTTDEQGPVRYQWFERSVAEWRDGQYPDNWDVTFIRLAELVRSDMATVGKLHDDAAAHADAFTPPQPGA